MTPTDKPNWIWTIFNRGHGTCCQRHCRGLNSLLRIVLFCWLSINKNFTNSGDKSNLFNWNLFLDGVGEPSLDTSYFYQLFVQHLVVRSLGSKDLVNRINILYKSIKLKFVSHL